MTEEIASKKAYKMKSTKIEEEQKVMQTTQLAPHCPYCQSKNVYGISRVVGYFSIIDNWNKSKQAEFKRRQKGNYWNSDLE